MRNYDTSRMIRLALAGAIAGLFIFLIFNPGEVRKELNNPTFNIDPHKDPFKTMEEIQDYAKNVQKAAPLDALIFTAAFAALVGGLLVIADEFGSPPGRVAKKMLRAVGSGALIGGTFGVIADCIFSALFHSSFLFILPARIIGWALMGVGAGAGIGVTLGSTKRMQMSIYGGLIGGSIGGILFDAVGMIFAQTGSVSRFIGFTIMGAAIGIAITFVEDMGKQNWLTVLSGPKEGRNYILTKPTTIIGKDELADIPLFGDVNVTKQHAQLNMIHYMVTLQAINGQMVMVNGAPVQAAQLKDSDTLQIGKFSLRFHQKTTQYANQYVQQPMPQYQPQYPPYSQPQSTPYTPQPTIMQPAAVPTSGILSLTVTAGPHLNQAFQFSPGVIKIGREDGFQILLAQDARVSRCHAEIVWDGQAWSARDLNSTNGLWVNCMRVTQQALHVGDQIGVGQTLMIVDSL